MSSANIGYRPRGELPRLGGAVVTGEMLLDTNVFINALTGREPPRLRVLLDDLPEAILSGPIFAELNWTKGRLDPAHPNTARVLRQLDQTLAGIDIVLGR